jgi:hypothetical protein
MPRKTTTRLPRRIPVIRNNRTGQQSEGDRVFVTYYVTNWIGHRFINPAFPACLAVAPRSRGLLHDWPTDDCGHGNHTGNAK